MVRIQKPSSGVPGWSFFLIVSLLLLLPASVVGRAEPQSTPKVRAGASTTDTYPKWSKVEVTLTGPDSIGLSTSSNPFKIAVSVKFRGPGGREYTVPAFYEGDGHGGLDGNVWRARFSPDAIGTWTYTSASPNSSLDGQSGSFEVVAPANCSPYAPGDMPDFGCAGRLEYAGGPFLKFADGPFWLKGGADDPEDFLAPGQTVGFASKEAAVDYLAGRGVSSLYILLNNVGGDGNNVWPWVGDTASEARQNYEFFDVAKLQQWEELFTYIQNRGIVLHLLFEDDSGWTGFNRDLFYREMVARFGHHNGLYWNISEEYNENYTADQVKGFAQLLSGIDAYDHPVTVHHQGDLGNWDPFVGDASFDLTSFQTGLAPQNEAAAFWFNRLVYSDRVAPVTFDETGKIGPDDRALGRHVVWSVYMGGANFEMHTSPLSDYRSFEEHFDDMHRARAFMEEMPFAQMRPANELVRSGDGYLLTLPGIVYATYLPGGGEIEIDLTATTNVFDVLWFNPRTGERQGAGSVSGGTVQTFAAPDNSDWVLRLTKTSGDGNVGPLALNGAASTIVNKAVAISLQYDDRDGPGPYTFTIVQEPEHGTLSGSGGSPVYTPDAGFKGSDTFAWRVNDGLTDSNIAVLKVSVDNADGSNQAPVAEDGYYATEVGTPVDVQLSYNDTDGPGPYTVTILEAPQHGTLTGDDNDRVYTPPPDFAGIDTFTWRVSDGEKTSNVATTTILASDLQIFLPNISR